MLSAACKSPSWVRVVSRSFSTALQFFSNSGRLGTVDSPSNQFTNSFIPNTCKRREGKARGVIGDVKCICVAPVQTLTLASYDIMLSSPHSLSPSTNSFLVWKRQTRSQKCKCQHNTAYRTHTYPIHHHQFLDDKVLDDEFVAAGEDLWL